MEVAALNGQSLFDIAVKTVGDVEAVFQIAADNGLSITDDLTVGRMLHIAAWVKTIDNGQLTIDNGATKPSKKTFSVRALPGQSLFDLCVQYSGSVEAAFDLAKANDVSVTGYSNGINPIVAIDNVKDRRVADYFRVHRLFPATGDVFIDEGIEFWAVEYDFAVS
jgi:hypothetical protein